MKPRKSEDVQAAPFPVLTLVSTLAVSGAAVTAITRVWNKGDCARCRLCPRCAADPVTSVCQVQVNEAVDKADAPLFSLVRFHGRGRSLTLYTGGE